MESASGLHIIADRPWTGYGTIQAAYVCPNCLLLNVASERRSVQGADELITERTAVATFEWEAPTWLPRYREVREFPDVPEHISQAAAEASLCLSVGAYRGAGALARAVIEATAKDKGAEGKDLRQRIDALRAADHIRAHTQEQAHEVRHFGNSMAHGDFADATTKEEAEEVVELMAEVLEEVYQSPARLERLKAARLAKKPEAG